MRSDNKYLVSPIVALLIVITGAGATAMGIVDSSFEYIFGGLVILVLGSFVWVECLGERIRDDTVAELKQKPE